MHRMAGLQYNGVRQSELAITANFNRALITSAQCSVVSVFLLVVLVGGDKQPCLIVANYAKRKKEMVMKVLHLAKVNVRAIRGGVRLVWAAFYCTLFITFITYKIILRKIGNQLTMPPL